MGVVVLKTYGSLLTSLHLGVWLVGVLFLSGSVGAADHPAFMPVKKLFAAMSEHDGEAMRATATDDFQLLEHGEDWTMQKLIDAVQPKGKPYERKNFFQQIRARQKGDVTWVSYWNKAEIRRDGGLRTVVWLESAVVVKENDRWKVQLLHSTRLDPDQHPKEIVWVPFETAP
ncbi:MAG: nuclear transport factor 2 family protein [Planctomycetota bacterium]